MIFISDFEKNCRRFKRPFGIPFVLQWQFHVCFASTWRHYCCNPRQIQPITSKKNYEGLGQGFIRKEKHVQCTEGLCFPFRLTIFILIVIATFLPRSAGRLL